VDPQGLCPECSGAQGYAADPYRPGWARGYRRTYYQRSSTDYGDPWLYTSYDTYDRGGFDGFEQGDDFDIGGDVGDDPGDGWTDS
jgi:hypothetical protein